MLSSSKDSAGSEETARPKQINSEHLANDLFDVQISKEALKICFKLINIQGANTEKMVYIC